MRFSFNKGGPLDIVVTRMLFPSMRFCFTVVHNRYCHIISITKEKRRHYRNKEQSSIHCYMNLQVMIFKWFMQCLSFDCCLGPDHNMGPKGICLIQGPLVRMFQNLPPWAGWSLACCSHLLAATGLHVISKPYKTEAWGHISIFLPISTYKVSLVDKYI